MSAGEPLTGDADSPVYCLVCNHDGRATCQGCGGRDGSYGKKPCRYCQEVIGTDPPPGAPQPPVPPDSPPGP